jgi:hypothetical protein
MLSKIRGMTYNREAWIFQEWAYPVCQESSWQRPLHTAAQQLP